MFGMAVCPMQRLMSLRTTLSSTTSGKHPLPVMLTDVGGQPSPLLQQVNTPSL